MNTFAIVHHFLGNTLAMMRPTFTSAIISWTMFAIISGTTLQGFDTWELSGVQLTCSPADVCDYYLQVTNKISHSLYNCHVQVSGQNGVPASKVQFQGVGCGGPGDTLKVSGGWKSSGMVLCFMDDKVNIWAVFELQNSEIESNGYAGPTKSLSAYSASVFDKGRLER